jgi:hypothetical protein
LKAPSVGDTPNLPQNHLQVGVIVVYRPPGDRRAIPCRIKHLEEKRAYLAPCPQPDVGWVELDNLQAGVVTLTSIGRIEINSAA